MTKERLQQHIANINQMCSELGENTRITIFVKQKGTTDQAWQADFNRNTYIDGAKLVEMNIIKIGKDE